MTPYESILANETTPQVLKALRGADWGKLQEAGDRLSDQQFECVRNWALHIGTGYGTQMSLVIGGVLCLLQAATSRADRRHHFLVLAEEFGLSETKAYNAVAAFRDFAFLTGEPKVMQQFPMVSLTVLSSRKATDEARAEAIDMARRGQRVTEKVAKELVTRYAPEVSTDEGHEETQLPTTWPGDVGRDSELDLEPKVDAEIAPGIAAEKVGRRPAIDELADDEMPLKDADPKVDHNGGLWAYYGEFVQVEVIDPLGIKDGSLVIRELEAALEAFRREHQVTDQPSPQAA
jgi:hypothetical protein